MVTMDLVFEIMFFENRSDAYKDYEANIRRFIANQLEISEQFVELQQKKEEQLYRGEISSNVFRLIGIVKSNSTQINDRQLLKLINEYCCREELNNSLISFHSSTFNGFPLLNTRLRSKNVRNLHSLHFGTLIRLKHFVRHIQILDFKAKLENAKMDVGDQKVDGIKAIFEHYKKRILIDIESHQTRVVSNQFIVDYASINYIVVSKVDNFWTIYLVLATPALLYEVEKVKLNNHSSEDETRSDNDEENEALADKVRYTKGIKHLRKTTLFRNIHPAVFTKSNVIEIRPKKNVTIDSHASWREIWGIVSRITLFSKTPVYIGKIQQLGKTLGDVSLPTTTKLPYNVHYAFQCLNNASYQLHDELYFHSEQGNAEYSLKFVDKIQELCEEDEKAAEEALYDVFYMKECNIPVDCFYALQKSFEERKQMKQFRSKNRFLVDIRRCILTPTRNRLLPPLPYQQSRFLRTSNPDRALRVYAKDDNYNELNFTVSKPGTPEHCKSFLEEHIFQKLLLGVRVNSRFYEYLGSSTSQLRDIGMMFYASESNGMNADQVRKEIGNLSHIKNPAKYIARLGQFFSLPMAFLNEIDPASVTVERDVTGGFKPYIFSDGVGMISEDLAVKLTSLVDENRGEPFSAFQIRHGGSKGMLTYWPHLTSNRIIIRESMKKFDSSSTSLDVVKVSGPRPLYLNRPFVNILEQLGVDASIFLTLVRQKFQQIVDSFSCKCKALEVIKCSSRLQLNYSELMDSEIDIFGEMFFRETQKIIISNTLKMMKSKARIQLPENSGRTMHGVLDETKKLKEGEVFVQYSQFGDSSKTKWKVVTGEILVTRSPCMHPGDVRKFTAVDIPELHHICDCIAFPQQGSRPIPDMMGGGDLDGDEYAIIWDEAYIFKSDNFPPMHYQSGGDANANRRENVEVWEMVQFYIDFIQKNNVGEIANAHLALSDFCEQGIFDDRCLTLSRQYPIALDFAKSGDLSNEPTPRATFYPDFIGKWESKPTYKSDRALGKIYRLCCWFEENAEFDSILVEQLSANERLLTFEGWDEFVEQATNAYNTYSGLILYIQRQFGIEDEFSLINGVCNKIENYVYSKNERNDVKKMINLLVKDAVNEMKELFKSSLNHFENSEELPQKQMALASAWYLVTKQMNENNENPYYGLPWLVDDVLCDVAKFNSKSDPKHVCVLNVDVNAVDEIPEMTISNIENVLLRWLKHNLKTFRGFQYVSGNEKDAYHRILLPIVNKLCGNVERIDIAIQQVFQELCLQLKSGDEFENMLALSASMTLRRFRRTKKFECFTQCSSNIDTEMDTWVTCLAYDLHPIEEMFEEVKAFRKYVIRDRKSAKSGFIKKLKASGVEDVCCDVYNRQLFVSATGKIECLKKLRNALTRKSFYTDVVKNIPLRFD